MVGKKNYLLETFFLVFPLFLTTVLYAQSEQVRTLTTANGLSQGMVTGLLQDKQGFIWAATLNGLNRYDGHRFKVYLHDNDDSTSIASNTLYALSEDRLGRIWMGTAAGIDCFDPQTERFWHLGQQYYLGMNEGAKDAPTQAISSLVMDSAGVLWVVSNSTISRIVVPDDFLQHPSRPLQHRIFAPTANLPIEAAWICSLALHGQTVGAVFKQAYWLYDKKSQTWQKQPIDIAEEGLLLRYTATYYNPADSTLWVLVHRQLQQFKNGQLRKKFVLPIAYQGGLGYKKALLKDVQGNLWALTLGNLFSFSPTELAGNSLIFAPKFAENYYSQLLLDRNNGVWVGSSGYGIKYRLPHRAKLFSGIAHLGSNYRLSVFSGDTIAMVKELHTELFSLTAGEIALQPALNAFSPDIFLRLRNGNVLFGYANAMGKRNIVCMALPSKKIIKQLPLDYYCAASNPITEVSPQTVWIGFGDGIVGCLAQAADKVRYFSFKKSLPPQATPRTWQIYPSADGYIWLATSEGIVRTTSKLPAATADTLPALPDIKVFRNIPNNRKSLNSNAIICILDDPKEPKRYLWVGTDDMGLNRLDKKTGECVRYTTANGLGDNVINGILADDYGNLWLSTNKGLSCFNIAHTYFRNYTTVDGLVNTEFNHQTYTKRPNGQLLFGGIDGIDALYPKDFLPDTTFAPVYFTALKINNKPVVVRDESGILPRSLAYTDAIYLRHTQNMVTVGFAALRFDKFGTESYQYKLEGADPDWVLAGSRTEASYSNLSPGNYTLSVASLNEAGDRNPHLTVLYITIAAPWWRTWAAYFCYALFLLLIAYFVVQAQIKRVRLQDEVTYKEKEAQQMQALDELKSRFFANITHEFRTPLTLIVEPARQIAETDSIDLAHVQVHIIRNNANRLLALVNQLLDLSKIESGKVQINWSEGDLWLIIEEVTTWFQPVIDKKRQILRIECALDTLEGITDRQGLEKIVYNLLSNAHKFTPEGGTITVKVTQPAPDSWQIEVKDNGIGIAPEKLPHIFDRFYQADNALTRSNEGTGIGLALVKELTELLGGTIAVASELGKGTTFTLTFPTRSAAAEGQYTTDKTVSALLEREMEAAIAQVVTNETDTADRSTVLLVEDNADMRQYLELVLTQKGYAVLQAENGRIGLEKARETVPDLIITDVMMPEMDGYELTEKLKNNPITSHIPIMILTAKGRQESKLTGYRKGADAYLPKPFQTEEVLIRLQQLLDTRRKMQQKYQATQLLPGENTPTPTDLAPPQTDAPITSEPQIQQIDRDWIAQLAAIIEARLSDERFTVDDLPTLVYMSRTQFYAKVKALTGLTPARILRDIRLKTAYQLVVTQPDITLESLAKQVGVNDIRHFSIIFKQQFGISPQDIILKNKPY